MKTKTLLSILALGFIVSAFGQNTLELTFIAENNGQHIQLDSILIENLTQGVDTTLYAPDTVLIVDYITGLSYEEKIDENTFFVSQNYPNPFKEKTKVNLYLPESNDIKISIRDILGREQLHYENTLKRGNHVFSFYPGNEKYYLLTITGKQTSKTIKMLNSNNNIATKGICRIVYTGSGDNEISFKSQRAINSFVFSFGDELKFTGYSEFGERIITDSPTASQTYTFQYAVGAPCPGMPTITDIDGNTYNTVQIDSQCWMKENLKTTTYQNGTPIPNVTDDNTWHNLTTGAYVWYDNDISWKNSYGALYNWHTTGDANGLCPTGWHVPSNDEWTVLTNFIGGINSPQGNELKSCRQVNSPLGGDCNTTEHPRWNQDSNEWGTDNYGFSGLPGGSRFYNGPFNYIGDYGYWWSTTQSGLYNASGLYLGYNAGNVYMGVNDVQIGFSVRCLRD